MHQLTKLGLTNSGFSKTVGPPNAPSNILITDMENRGPISTSDISPLSIAVKPGVFCGFFSIIYTEYSLNIHRSQRQCCSNIFFYLVVSEPNAVVDDGEGQDVVNERLGPAGSFWYVEDL